MRADGTVDSTLEAALTQRVSALNESLGPAALADLDPHSTDVKRGEGKPFQTGSDLRRATGVQLQHGGRKLREAKA